MIFDCHVDVQLRPGISDPQGSTIEKALPALGFDGVAGVRVGKRRSASRPPTKQRLDERSRTCATASSPTR